MSRMRTKATDRFLAVLLSILMVFTVIPITTLTTFAATTDITITLMDEYTRTDCVEGAKVTLKNDELGINKTLYTDANGKVSFVDIEIGEEDLEDIVWQLEMSKDGYRTIEFSEFSFSQTSVMWFMERQTVAQNTVSVSVTGATVKLNDVVQNSIEVDKGSQVKVEIIPAAGSYLSEVKKDTVAQTVPEKYQSFVATVTADNDITFTAKTVKEFTVSKDLATYTGGTVTLNGGDAQSVTVDEGTNIPLLVEANDGYWISSVIIDGVSQTIDNVAEFSTSIAASKNIAVVVSFVKVYTVEVSYDANGTVVTTPSSVGGKVTVETGESVKVDATPNTNYRVDSVVINDVADTSVKGNNDETYSKTLTADKDYTVVITFAPNKYNVTTGTTENGSYSAEKGTVEHGTGTKVIIKPDAGYTVATAKVNGTSVAAIVKDGNEIYFNIENIVEDITAVVTFKKTAAGSLDDITIDPDTKAIRKDGNLYVIKSGDAINFEVNAFGYAIALFEANGALIGGDETTEVVEVNSNKTVATVKIYYQADGEFYKDWHEVACGVEVVVDDIKPSVTVTPDAKDNGEYYNDSFNVSVEAKDTGKFSGIEKIEYFVTDEEIHKGVAYEDVAADDLPRIVTLYAHESDIEQTVTGTITVKVSENKNNSDFVSVWLKITDRAGNVEYVRENYKVNCTAPKLLSVAVDGTLHAEAETGYYNAARTATLTIVDRASTFDQTAATNGISITAKDAKGNDVTISKPAMVVWQSSGDTHIATITFDTDANYTWSIDYENIAGKKLDKSDVIEQGDSIYAFTVDKKAPTGTISFDVGGTWDKLLNTLTFGIWNKVSITATATKADEISETKEILYYKSNSTTALSEGQLEDLYEEGKFGTATYTVSADEKFVVYARITDYAGNTLYISTDGAIVDTTKSKITLVPEAANTNGFYNDDVEVSISVSDVKDEATAYSGIKTIDYQVIDVNKNNTVTQSGNLYTFDKVNPRYEDLEDAWSGKIKVISADNNSSNVKVVVTVEDNAGHVHSEEITLAINIDTITASVSLDGTANKIDNGRGYFSVAERTAILTINERADAFDAIAATNGISIAAKDAKGNDVADAYKISPWTSVGDVHTATIAFSGDANYDWSFSYTNKADNVLDVATNLSTETSATPFKFTVDDTDPTGTVTVNSNTWDKILNILTFGLYSNDKAEVSATSDDATSPVIVEYFKTSNPIAMNEEALNNETFAPYSDFTVDSDEQFVVYLKITDYAGNYIYINSDGFIVDKRASNIVLIPSAANGKLDDGAEKTLYYKDSDVYVDVTVTDAEPYSGIQSVEYWVENAGEETQRGTLYTFNVANPAQADLKNEWSGRIAIDKALNNSCDVKVYVKTIDNAKNNYTDSVALDIDITEPTIDVTFDNNTDNNGNTYFDAKRTATVVITERAHHFDATAATNGISITAKDAKGNDVADAYTISDWVETPGTGNGDNTKWAATVSFNKDANYTWSISYTDKAGNANEPVTTGDSVAPWDFTVDTVAPNGSVTATSTEGRSDTWTALKDSLTFGFWSQKEITITGTADDATSGPIAKIAYYKVKSINADDGTTALKATDLDAVTEWTTVADMQELNAVYDVTKVSSDEQFTVYIKMTDLAGNYSYMSTNGLIVDHNAPVVETIAPEITIEPEQPINDIYKGDVKVAIKVVDKTIGGTYAGIKTIKYQVKNMGVETQSGNLYAFDIDDPKQSDLLQTWTGEITVDSSKNNSNDVEIIVWAEDNALNADDDSVKIKVDTTDPTIDVTYDNNAADSDTFFKDDRTATVVVTERNLKAKDVVFTVTKDGQKLPVACEWTEVPGTGNLDDTQWKTTIKFTADGDYTFAVECTDLASRRCEQNEVNYGESVAETAFTIDKTLPTVAVSYDNNNAANGNYYKADRTATITITEHNFDAARVKILGVATDNGAPSIFPAESKWSSNGNIHTATISYTADSKYTFDIEIMDKAGNSITDFTPDEFYIDKTNPILQISGIVDQSANNSKGNIGFVITATDTNFNGFTPVLSAVIMNKENGFETKNINAGQTETVANGQKYTVANIDTDGVYSITCTLVDLAGNEFSEVILMDANGKAYTEQRSGTDKLITFSINRNGSTFLVEGYTKEVLENYYVKEITSHIELVEINPDPISENTVTQNGKALTENTDYKVSLENSEGGWYKYTYSIDKELFESEGEYSVIVSSKDKATNDAFSDVKGATVNFVVDRTVPIITITGMAADGRYQTDSQKVTLIPTDDGGALKSLIVRTVDENGNQIKELVNLSGDALLAALEENSGKIEFNLAEGLYQNIQIICNDSAVGEDNKNNIYDKTFTNVSVSSSGFMIFWANKPLRWGSIAGVIILAAAIVFFILYKKRKNK